MDPYQYKAGKDVNFEYAPVVNSNKKRRKRKKKATTTAEVLVHADGRGVTINNIPKQNLRGLRGAAGVAADSIWNVTAAEERSRVRAFWLSLTEAERMDLVRLDKDVLLQKVRKQRHPCGCSVCGKKRVAVEQELEALYQAYYREIEAFGAREAQGLAPPSISQPPLVAPPQLHPHPHPHTDDHQHPPPPQIVDEDEFSDYYDQYDELGGGILSVADDLLKNDGRRFVDVMEHLAAQRIQREHPPDHCQDDEDFEDDEFEDDEDDFNDDQSIDESIQSASSDASDRLADGRRMLQIFAARMFEQRILNAYREHIARERQQQLLLEIEQEDEAQNQKEAKKQKDKEKRKTKKALLRQQREEAEQERLAKEQREKEQRKQEEERRRHQREEAEREREDKRRREIEERMAKLSLQEERAKAATASASTASAASAATPKKKAAQTPATPAHSAPPQSTPAHSTPAHSTPAHSTPTAPPKAFHPQGSARPAHMQSTPAQVPKRSQLPAQLPQVAAPQIPRLASPQLAPPHLAHQSPQQRPFPLFSQPSSLYKGFGAQAAPDPSPWLRKQRVQWPVSQHPAQPQWATPATPVAPATPTGLWASSSTSCKSDLQIKTTAIACCERLKAEGCAPDGYVPSQVLFHATMDALGASISQNEMFRACGIDSQVSEFECVRDHVGLVTHVRYVP